MKLRGKLLEIQSKLVAPKSQYNKFGNYAYRNCEDILEAVKPLLLQAKATLTLTDKVEMIGNRFYVLATATLEDIEVDKENNGTEFISVSAYARENDIQKGMNEAQITGSVSSYARKYALNGLFLVDDNKDPDFARQEPDKAPEKEAEKAPAKLEDSKCANTELQIKKLYSEATSKGYTALDVKKVMMDKFKKGSANDLTKAEYSVMLKGYEGLKSKEGK